MAESTTTPGRKPRVTDEDLLDVFRATADPVLSTAEVAEQVPIKRRGTLDRLRALEDAGELASKQIGGRNTVWWRDGDTDAESGRERAVTPSTDAPDRSDPSPPPAGETDTDDDLAAAVDAVAEGWEDTDARLAARKDAARAVLEYAREHGTVSKQEAEEEVYPEYPVEGQTPDTWYRQNVRPVLNEAAEYDPSARAYRLDLEDVDA